MKKNKASYFVGIVFICIIAAFFASVCFRFYRAQRYYDYGTTSDVSSETDTSSEASVSSNWSEQYPFSEEYTFETDELAQYLSEEAEEDSEEESSGYLTLVDTIENNVDYYTTKLLPGRMKYVEVNALFNKIVGMNIILGTDSVVVMKNGYLTFESAKVDTSYAAKSLKWFSDILEEKDIDFTYIQYPSKENEEDNQLPDGVVDYNNLNADSLLEKLDDEEVKYLDMRELLKQKDSNWYLNFFRTDHHWKPETGVWAAGKIVDMLNSDFGYSLDSSVGDINNYNVEVYEKYNLGSQGKVATLTYADPEDISLIYPKDEVSFTVKYNTDPSQTGSFENVLLNKTNLNNTDYYNYSAYATYLDGNKAITSIKNNNCKNGQRILVIGGSYNKTVVPYLAQTVERIDLLDRRYFNGSVISYIEQTEPDVVIVAYTPSLLSSSGGHSSLFNFE